jgi:hypothetical protein
MFMRRLIALAAGALALSAQLLLGSAIAQTPPKELTPEQAAKARELAVKGEALFVVLKDPARCGAPAPKGYACALVLYKDVSEDRARDRLPETLVARVTGLAEADGLARDAKVRVLSPFDASARTFSPLEMTVMRMSVTSSTSGREMAILEMQAVMGYAENEALPKGDKRKVDRARFKIPKDNLQRY